MERSSALVGSRRLSKQWMLIAFFAFFPLVCAPPASAQPPPTGRWKITYAWTGSVTTNGYTGALAHHRHVGGRGYTSAQASVVANVVATLKWVDSSDRPAPNPPKTVNLLEDGFAYADCVGATWSASASDGLGDPSVLDSGGASSMGRRLTRKDGSSGTITLSRSLTASGSALDMVSRWAWVMVDYDYTVQLDPRAVWLNRSQTRAVAVDPVGRIYNDRIDGDGITPRGDTIYSYIRTSASGAGSVSSTVYNSQTFQPGWSAEWQFIQDSNGIFTINGDWAWNPGDWSDKWDYGLLTTPIGRMEWFFGKWVNKDAANDIAITYSVTDRRDKAQASANYILTMHGPRETVLINPDRPKRILVGDPPGGRVWQTATFANQTLNFGITRSFTHSIGVSFTSDIAQWFGKENFGIEANYTYSRTFESNFSTAVSDVPVGYGTYLELYNSYVVKSGIVDLFDAGGYTGYDLTSLDVPDGIELILHTPYTYRGVP